MDVEEFLTSPDAARVYRLRVVHPSEPADLLAARAGLTAEQVDTAEQALAALGLLRPSGQGGWTAVTPDRAADQLLAQTELEIARQHLTITAARARLSPLIDHYLEARSMRDLTHTVEHIRGIDNVRAVIDELSRTSGASLDAAVPPVTEPRFVRAMVEAALPLDLDALSRGMKLRYILDTDYRRHAEGLRYARSLMAGGAAVRGIRLLPTRVLIYDGTSALIPEGPGNTGPGAMLVREPAVLKFLNTLFESLWEQSGGFMAGRGASAQPPTGAERAVLHGIAAGRTSSAIARELGVSLRTVTRLTAVLMRRLGTESRFQAGVRAVQLGWIGEEGP